VDSGSSSARSLGILGLAVGMPVAMLGMGLFGYGTVDDQSGLRTAGLVTLAVGAASSLAALPLLALGSTSVRNAHGTVIATYGYGPRL